MVDCQLHAPTALPQERETLCPLYWKLVVPRAGLDRCVRSRPHRHSIQSLYQLSYPGLTLSLTHDVAGRWPATSWAHYTTNCNTHSSVPEDGQNYFSKHVELTGIINKPLLLHLVGCLYYLHQ